MVFHKRSKHPPEFRVQYMYLESVGGGQLHLLVEAALAEQTVDDPSPASTSASAHQLDTGRQRQELL